VFEPAIRSTSGPHAAAHRAAFRANCARSRRMPLYAPAKCWHNPPTHFMTKYLLKLSPILGLVLITACVCDPPPPLRRPAADLPGQRADGSVLLPNQWSLRPAGKQIVTGDFPVNIAVHPEGRFAALLHSGYGRHQIVVVDVVSAAVVGEFPVEETFYGMEFSRDGRELYCSGAGDEVIHAFTFRDGYLSDPKVLRIRDAKERGIPAGLALSSDARRLFVANVWGQRISQVDLGEAARVTDIELGTTNGPPRRGQLRSRRTKRPLPRSSGRRRHRRTRSRTRLSLMPAVWMKSARGSM